MDWQAIDGAPKDGTAILAWNGSVMTTVIFDDDMGGCWNVVYPGSYAEDESFYRPTHWMPLPAPPRIGGSNA